MDATHVTDTLMEGERELLPRALGGDASALRALFSRYARPVFSYLLNLSGCGRDAAYEKTTELLSDRLRARTAADGEWFLIDCLRAAIDAARVLPVRASLEAAPGEPPSWRFMREALSRLTFDEKAFLLLRDQLCLPYAAIAQVHHLTERDARMRVERARLSLREALENLLRMKEGPS